MTKIQKDMESSSNEEIIPDNQGDFAPTGYKESMVEIKKHYFGWFVLIPLSIGFEIWLDLGCVILDYISKKTQYNWLIDCK